MKTVAVFEAKNRLSEILAAVAHGEEYTVTKHGAAVARIVPAARKMNSHSLADADRHIARIKAARKDSHMTDKEYREAVDEGRD